MGQEIPPRAKGITNEQYKKILIDAYNNNPFVKLRIYKRKIKS